MNKRREKYTLELLAPIVEQSRSMSEVMKKLGYHPGGGAYMHLKGKIQRLGIDTSHWLGQRWAKGLTGEQRTSGVRRRSAEVLLVLGRLHDAPIGGAILTRVLRERGRKYSCEACGVGDVWNGKSIVLEVDHKNGLRHDNTESNLRFLCPNCHSQTDNYCGRKLRKDERDRVKHHCSDCGDEVAHLNNKCRSCGQLQRTNRITKILWPDDDVILRMVQGSSRLAVGRALGVSDNAVLKHLRRRNLPIPEQWYIKRIKTEDVPDARALAC